MSPDIVLLRSSPDKEIQSQRSEHKPRQDVAPYQHGGAGARARFQVRHSVQSSVRCAGSRGFYQTICINTHRSESVIHLQLGGEVILIFPWETSTR